MSGRTGAVPPEPERPSGLRNPRAAVRGLGAGTFVIEAVVLLLAIQPIRVLGGGLSRPAIWAVVALAGACVALAGAIPRRWAWFAGGAVQVLLLASGVLHWSLTALGLVFGLTWLYVLHVRRTILRS